MSGERRLTEMSRFGRLVGYRITERSDGIAVVECEVTHDHANTKGVAHGGLISGLLDTAAGAAVAYQPSVAGAPVMTVSLSVSFLAPAKVGDRLVARARRTGGGRRLVFCDAIIVDQRDETIATAQCTLAVARG